MELARRALQYPNALRIAGHAYLAYQAYSDLVFPANVAARRARVQAAAFDLVMPHLGLRQKRPSRFDPSINPAAKRYRTRSPSPPPQVVIVNPVDARVGLRRFNRLRRTSRSLRRTRYGARRRRFAVRRRRRTYRRSYHRRR